MACLAAAVAARAQPGTLDPGFTANVTGSIQEGNVLALQPMSDGTLFIAGTFSSVNNTVQWGVARLQTNGMRDPTFTASAPWSVNALVVDSSNRVIVAGALTNVNGLSATNMARLLPDGATDTSFSVALSGTVSDVALLAEGKMLVGGAFSGIWQDGGFAPRNFITRLNDDGTDDHAFASTNRGPNGSVRHFALQPDGRILVVGTFSRFDGEPHAGIVRLNADTTLDPSFSCQVIGSVWQAALQPDGKILIAGSFQSVNGVARASLARVNADGSLDAAFDADLAPVFSTVRSVAVDSAGHIYLGGDFTSVTGTRRTRFARLHADGALDTGFNTANGMPPSNPAYGPNSTVNRIVVLPNDDVVIGGAFGAYNGVTASRVARIQGGASIAAAPAIVTSLGNRFVTAGNAITLAVTATGSPRLDYYWYRNGTYLPEQRRPTWQTNYALPEHAGTYTVIVSNELGTVTSEGVLTVTSSPPGFSAHPTNRTALLGHTVEFRSTATGAPLPAVSWQLNGAHIGNGSRLVLSNVTYSHAGDYRAIASNAVGVATSAVATLVVNAPPTNAGAVDIRFYPEMASDFGGVSSAVVQPDGQIIVASGGTPGANPPTRIRRLRADGSLDTSFNTNASAYGQVASMALQSDGRLVIGGSFNAVNGTNRYQLARLLPDGEIDPEFNPMLETWSVKYVIAQPDGKILVAGDVLSPSQTEYMILGRVLPDGSRDPNFKPLLRTATPGALPPSIAVGGLALQPDGKILLSSSLGVHRFLPHGSIDAGFSVTNVSPPYRSIVVANDGKILLGHGASTAGPRISRLNSDGSVDPTYVSGVSNSVETIVLQPDGKVLIAVDAGDFAPASRNVVRRLNRDGSVDDSFDAISGRERPSSYSVMKLLMKQSGEILAIGDFQEFNGYFRPGIVQLLNDAPRAPEITRPPQPLNIFEGQTASFSVDATVPPAPSYEWRKDDVTIPGVNGPLLRWTNTRLSDAGSYTVVISNTLGSVTSAPAALVVSTAPTHAGAVDIRFGDGSGPNDIVYAAAKQPDGKIIIGGLFTEVDGVTRSCVARLNADGSLDTSFDPGAGAGGVPVPEVHALALQSDGRIVVGGQFLTFGGRSQLCIARLHADGSVDTSFATNRFSGSPGIFPITSTVYALAIQPDGKIVLGSNSSNPVERVNTNGTRDASFALISGSPPGRAVYSLLLEPDGKIVCGGDVIRIGVLTVNGLWRLHTNGALEAVLGSHWTEGTTRAIQSAPDGYLVAGSYGPSATNAVLRLQADGSIRLPWSMQRIVQPVYAAAIDDCGRIVIGGTFREVGPTPARGLARLTSSGGIESSFAPVPMTDGNVRVVLPLGGRRYFVAGDFTEINGVVRPGVAQIIEHVEGPPLITRPPTNEITFAGHDLALSATVDCPTHTAYQWTRDGVAIAGATNATVSFPNARPVLNGAYRLIASNAHGSTTSSVAAVNLTMPPTMPGRNDIEFYPSAISFSSITALAAQPDGKLLVGGTTPSPRLLRLNTDGSVDTSFAVTNSLVSPATILVQSNGQIMIGGASQMLRLNSDGTHDRTFVVPSGYAARVIAMQPDGKYIFAGSVQGALVIRRLDRNGSPDPSFVAPRPDNAVHILALRPDGKVLAGGVFSYWTSNFTQLYWSKLAQFHTNGFLDMTFATEFAGGGDSVHAIALEPEGTVLAGGSFATYNQRPSPPLLRLGQDGSADPAFNPPLSNSAVYAIALQADGKIVIGGGETGVSPSVLGERGIARLRRDGTLDTGFDPGMGARRNSTFPAVLALASGPRGKIYAAGNFFHYDGFPRPFVARLHGDPDILGPVYTGADFSFSMYTDLARTYHLETATSPDTATWTVIQTLTGNSAVQTFIDPAPTNPARFYRIRVQ